MPRLRRRLLMPRYEGLSPLLRIRLLTGEYYWFLDGSEVDDTELPGLWKQYRDELLREYAADQAARRDAVGELASAYPPEFWLEPCWGEYNFELIPRYGPRREGELWSEYYKRCGIERS